MPWIFVLRNTSSKTSRIWESNSLTRLIAQIKRYRNQKVRVPWSPKIDAYVLENYKRIPARLIGKHIGKMLHRPAVHRGAVIGRYHRLAKKALKARAQAIAADLPASSPVNGKGEVHGHPPVQNRL